MGIDILWLMPIHPIGEKNRKGTLGSPYSVKDYFGVNPEFGTEADFRAFVEEAHSLGMRVILDWVANQSASDNPLVEEHPEWYSRDWKGEFHPTPWWDWTDIIDFDYSQPGIREYMTNAMKYSVTEFDVDGYRCDVAGYVPLDFWNKLRQELDAIKHVFMLAEWESRDLHREATQQLPLYLTFTFLRARRGQPTVIAWWVQLTTITILGKAQRASTSRTILKT